MRHSKRVRPRVEMLESRALLHGSGGGLGKLFLIPHGPATSPRDGGAAALVRRLNLHRRFRLTVVGIGPSGVPDIAGNLLDGQKTGRSGSNFVTIVSAENLA